MWMVESQISINNICVVFIQHYVIVMILCTTDVNKPEKKDQVLKTCVCI